MFNCFFFGSYNSAFVIHQNPTYDSYAKKNIFFYLFVVVNICISEMDRKRILFKSV